jgi:xanthosine utilization system XapX-like protein
MRMFILSLVCIVLSGLVYGWLIVHHPYVAQCIGISMVGLGGIIWIVVMFNAIKRGQ